jgi:DivIVA domain-containing protein
MSDEELMARIENVRFTPVRREAGYDMGDVDGLLDHLQAAVRVGEPLRPIVDLVKLRTTKLREGYAVEEVDAFLEVLAGPADAGTTSVPPVTAADPVVQEQRGFLARLFGR